MKEDAIINNLYIHEALTKGFRRGNFKAFVSRKKSPDQKSLQMKLNLRSSFEIVSFHIVIFHFPSPRTGTNAFDFPPYFSTPSTRKI